MSSAPETNQWYRGDRLNENYRGESYIVPNWRAHRLHSPGRGRHWVHVNNQYLLVTIASGLIIETILSAN